jgi:hypothetical protein
LKPHRIRDGISEVEVVECRRRPWIAWRAGAGSES